MSIKRMLLCGIILLMPITILAEEPLVTAAAVRELLPSEAAEKRPVKLSGIVTYYRSDHLPDFVLQDATGGVHVAQKRAPDGPGVHVEPGDEVEIEGVTDAAAYAPRVAVQSVKKIGRVPLPLPIPATVEELQAGYREGQLIEVKAVVREAYIDKAIDPPRLVLRLATPAGSIDSMVVRFEEDDVKRYKDARVSLRGIPLRQQNRRVVPYLWHIFTHSVNDIVIIDPPREPFVGEKTPINQILAAGPQQSQQRILITGTVTYADDFVVVQNGEDGIRVIPRGENKVQLGDVVEVSGFGKLGMFNPILVEALIRVVGKAALPEPDVLDLDKLKVRELAERDWRRIQISGTVTDVNRQKGNQFSFNIRTNENKIIPVLIADGVQFPTEIVRDMYVQVTGVCDLNPGEGVILLSYRPTSFNIFVGKSSDVVILGAPSWWTRERLLYMAVGVGFALFLATVWALALRKRVEQRSRELASEIRARAEAEVTFAAISSERKRLAAELHDSLEQGLTGVALQLDAAALSMSDGKSLNPKALDMARSMLAHSRAEVRRSVWDLNADADEQCDLLVRLQNLTKQLENGQSASITYDVTGESRSINGLCAHHVTRIIQESVHNALRHGAAEAIGVHCVFTTDQLTITISDNGKGFALDKVAGPQAGHFGLQGIKERAKKINATISIESVLDKGTTITITIPGTSL